MVSCGCVHKFNLNIKSNAKESDTENPLVGRGRGVAAAMGSRALFLLCVVQTLLFSVVTGKRPARWFGGREVWVVRATGTGILLKPRLFGVPSHVPCCFSAAPADPPLSTCAATHFRFGAISWSSVDAGEGGTCDTSRYMEPSCECLLELDLHLAYRKGYEYFQGRQYEGNSAPRDRYKLPAFLDWGDDSYFGSPIMTVTAGGVHEGSGGWSDSTGKMTHAYSCNFLRANPSFTISAEGCCRISDLGANSGSSFRIGE